MHIGLRRALRPRLLILVTLLLALGGAVLTGTAGPASAASTCSAGTYFNGSTCVPADPGFYVAVAGASSETPCPLGTFQPNAGQTACEPATAGHFVDTVAAVSPRRCLATGQWPPARGLSC